MSFLNQAASTSGVQFGYGVGYKPVVVTDNLLLFIIYVTCLPSTVEIQCKKRECFSSNKAGHRLWGFFVSSFLSLPNQICFLVVLGPEPVVCLTVGSCFWLYDRVLTLVLLAEFPKRH